jgi:hypothetical protein
MDIFEAAFALSSHGILRENIIPPIRFLKLAYELCSTIFHSQP